MFVLPRNTEMTPEILGDLIKRHQKLVVDKYKPLKDMYEGDHKILHESDKEAYKPDNRIVVNFAKYIVDTLNGFFIGIPIKTSHEDKGVQEYIDFLDAYNDQDDNNAELSKFCDIYGHGFELLFTDEDAQVGITKVSPMEGLVVRDESIRRRPIFGIRYYTNTAGELEGSYSTANKIVYFDKDYKVTEEHTHFFGGVPLIEYRENEECLGSFETVDTMINAYNKALSEKANDVDYYADAYLVILGAALDDKTLKKLRDSRIINLKGSNADKVIVEFLQKPDADGTQENLINRLEQLIFQISMVANINDKNFGNVSGIALAYKLQAMNNLAKTKERKFISALNQRYRLISNLPTSKMGVDDWLKVKYQFTRNIPKNILEEAQVAQALSGITSQETQLSVLSVVDSVSDELEKKAAETQMEILTRAASPQPMNTKSMYGITSILQKYKSGTLTRTQAIKMFELLGISEEKAVEYLDEPTSVMVV